jgi:hypothetical protein
MITTIAEHSVDLDILPQAPYIMDIGCRGFLFAEYFYNRGEPVFCIDIDELEEVYSYTRVAIAGYTGKCGISRNADPQATKMGDGEEINCYTLEDFSKKLGTPFWDLIKMDIEGAEYEVIMSFSRAPAKQLSIEFHLHTGIYTQDQVAQMIGKLKDLGYEIAKHELTTEHGAGFNYWDSLFILK